MSHGTVDIDQTAAVRAAVDAGAGDLVRGLVEWLRIPSISGDPAHHDDVRRSADHFAQALRDTGFPTVEVWETAGLPAVFAEWPSDDPDAPTALVYGHHDVQPVTRWTSGSTRRSSPPSTANGCTHAAPPTTRDRSGSTCSACARTSRRPAAPARP